MKKSYFFLGLFIAIFSSANLFAAEDEAISSNDYRYKVAQQVFLDLIDAKGDNRMKIPEFVMSNKKSYVAWMDGQNAQIGLEAEAYDVCRKFGADSLNAIAALLGHEITHYYEKHSWGSQFSAAYADLDISNTVNSGGNDLKAVNETEADYLGGFLAYSAGYQTFGIMPQMLTEVYATYGLGNEIPGYPSLGDRITLARESEVRLAELVHVFEMANYLSILGNYEEADGYYAYILKEFQSREIFNNAGVNAVTGALSLVPTSEPQAKFAYPLQIDNDSRLSVQARGRVEGFAEKGKFITQMRQAIQYFEQAYALDREYATALVNLACAKDILGTPEDADYYAKKAIKVARNNGNTKAEADAYIIRGIAAINEGEAEDGIDYLNKAISKSDDATALAKLNIYIAENGERPAVEPAPKAKLSLSSEKIDDISLSAFMDDPDVEQLMEINTSSQLGVKELNGSKILLHLLNGGEEFVLLQTTYETYQGTSGTGVGIGSSASEVEQGYGVPSYIQQTPNGLYMVYKAKKAIFQIQNGSVVGWSVYRK